MSTRHSQGEARVIPLLLHAVDWQNTPLGKLQVLPPDAKPIVKWRHYDEGFVAITQEIRKVINELRDLKKQNITPEIAWEVVPLRSSGPGPFSFTIRPRSRLPLSRDLLALLNQYKETCQRLDIPFLTPHLLLALFEIHDSKAQHYLNLLTPPRADQVLSILRHIVDVRLPTREVPFSDFQWEDRQDVWYAQTLASDYGSFEVTEEHLLLAVLCMESASSTVRGLKGFLGESSFQELAVHIQSSLSIRSRRPSTPIDDWF